MHLYTKLLYVDCVLIMAIASLVSSSFMRVLGYSLWKLWFWFWFWFGL